MIRPEIAALIKRGNITVKEHHTLRDLNPDEWEAAIPALTTEALVKATEGILEIANPIGMRSPVAALGHYVPELLKRLRAGQPDPKDVEKAAHGYAKRADFNAPDKVRDVVTHGATWAARVAAFAAGVSWALRRP